MVTKLLHPYVSRANSALIRLMENKRAVAQLIGVTFRERREESDLVHVIRNNKIIPEIVFQRILSQSQTVSH